MADITRTEGTLKFDFDFADGDTRSFSLPNPKASISTDEVEELNAYIADNGLLIGDKAGATFNRITKVTKIAQVKRYLDLE